MLKLEKDVKKFLEETIKIGTVIYVINEKFKTIKKDVVMGFNIETSSKGIRILIKGEQETFNNKLVFTSSEAAMSALEIL